MKTKPMKILNSKYTNYSQIRGAYINIYLYIVEIYKWLLNVSE